MTKLTDEQIAELAPDWAKYYSFSVSVDIAPKVISFYCQEKSRGKWFYLEKGNWSPDSYSDFSGDSNAKPISRKEFDIGEYEFSDAANGSGVEFRCSLWAYPDIEINVKDVNGGDNTAVLMKEHAIALAKHFKLTAEDLK